MGAVVESTGLLFVGYFQELRQSEKDGKTLSEVIVRTVFSDGSTRDRGVLYDQVDYDTGEVTRLQRVLSELAAGTPIALRVRIAPSRNGRGTWTKALNVEVCQVSESPSLHAVS